MKLKCTDNKLIQNLSVWYVVIVVLYQSLYLLLPFRQIMDLMHLGVLSPLLAMVGLGILCWDLLFDRIFFKVRECWLLLTILVVLTVSTVLNYHYGFSDSVKVLIWQSAQMLLVFTVWKRQPAAQWDEVWKKMYLFLTGMLIPANLISFAQYMLGIGYVVKISDGTVRQGLLDGRLFGLYTSPHYASVLMIILVISSVFFLMRVQKKSAKIWYGIFAAQYLLIAVLTGTRSIRVALPCAVFLLVSCTLLAPYSMKKISGGVKRIVCSLGAGLLAAGILFGVFDVTEMVFKSASMAVQELKMELEKNSNYRPEATDPNGNMLNELDDFEKEEIQAGLDRSDISAGNISNNRFVIWMDYMEVIADRPVTLLFGASPGGYMKYIAAEYPDRYIVSHIRDYYPRQFANGVIYDTHNAYLSAFASGGVIGTVLLAIFLGSMAIRGIICVFRGKKASITLMYLLTEVSFILFASFFDTDLFFKCTSASMYFWFMSGFLCHTIHQIRQEK